MSTRLGHARIRIDAPLRHRAMLDDRIRPALALPPKPSFETTDALKPSRHRRNRIEPPIA